MVDLVAALDLLGVELPERSLEAPMHVLGIFRGGGGDRRRRERQPERGGENKRFAQHWPEPPYSAGATAAPSGDSTGVEMVSGTGSVFSRQPTNGMRTQKKPK